MEDPFKVGLKAFFGVATGFGILVLTFNVIQSIDYSINDFMEKQKREKLRIQREEARIQREEARREEKRIERERREEKRLEREKAIKYAERAIKSEGWRPPWMQEKIKECLNYRTKKEIYYCVNIYSPFKK
tara:strand:+ start:163 stop:555 length:393 start_codon:yes stop_codon:yes gene_type:complete